MALYGLDNSSSTRQETRQLLDRIARQSLTATRQTSTATPLTPCAWASRCQGSSSEARARQLDSSTELDRARQSSTELDRARQSSTELDRARQSRADTDQLVRAPLLQGDGDEDPLVNYGSRGSGAAHRGLTPARSGRCFAVPIAVRRRWVRRTHGKKRGALGAVAAPSRSPDEPTATPRPAPRSILRAH